MKTIFFKVIAQKQTYQNLAYLFFSFPLGIIYFVLVVTGLSLGLGLMITWLGIPILLGTMLLWRLFARFELRQAEIILGIDMHFPRIDKTKGIWKKTQAYLNDALTWKSLAYILMRLPLGILAFVLLVTLLSIPLSLIATPVMYHLFETGVIQGTFCEGTNIFCTMTDSYVSVILIGIIGVLLLFIALHALNSLARILGLTAKALLKRS